MFIIVVLEEEVIHAQNASLCYLMSTLLYTICWLLGPSLLWTDDPFQMSAFSLPRPGTGMV